MWNNNSLLGLKSTICSPCWIWCQLPVELNKRKPALLSRADWGKRLGRKYIFNKIVRQFSPVKHWPEDSVVMEISAASFLNSSRKPYKIGMFNTVLNWIIWEVMFCLDSKYLFHVPNQILLLSAQQGKYIWKCNITYEKKKKVNHIYSQHRGLMKVVKSLLI